MWNGAQALLSTSQLSSIVANNNKLIYVVMQPFELAASSNIFRDTGPYMAVLGGTSGAIRFRNYDGTTDDASIAGSLTPMIFRGRHTGGNVYAAVDTGAGFTESAPVASGDTTVMTDTLRIGNTSSGFYGKILGIATANTGVAKPNLENLLREYFFARSQLRWDPYLADLVLKRQ